MVMNEMYIRAVLLLCLVLCSNEVSGFAPNRQLRPLVRVDSIESCTSLQWSLQDVSDFGTSLTLPILFAGSFRLGAAIAVIGQPRLPRKSEGCSLNVASKVVRLPEKGSRVRLFFPTSEPVETCAKYCTDGRATSDGMAGLVGFKQLGLSFLLAHLADATSGCLLAGDDLRNTHQYPLLVYSHGYGGNMDMATYFLRGLAQEGIIVAAVEHTDGTASSTLLADDKRLDFDPSMYSLRDGLRLRSEELLEALEVCKDLFDVDKIFLGGHSYGCPSAILASQLQNNQAIDGLLLHDPALSMGSGSLELPPKIPTVSYVSDEYCRAGVRCGEATYHIQGAFHGNFVDAPLWAPLWVMRTLSMVIPACGPADPEEVHFQLAKSAKAFFELDETNPNNEKTSVEQPLFERVGYRI